MFGFLSAQVTEGQYKREGEKLKVQLRGLNLQANQLTANDKVNVSAIFKSASEKITSISIILKIY